jgi:CRP-like cAMP-binding protein
MRERRFSAGEILFAEGDESHEAFVLRTGRVEISRRVPRGTLRLAVLGKGDVLGEMGLLSERPRSATARALEDVVAEAFGPAEFAQSLLADPRRSMRLLSALFERLRSMNDMLAESAGRGTGVDVLPGVRLVPSTAETRRVLPENGLEVSRFPFRVGRKAESTEAQALSFNEIEIADREPYLLALNHFSIELAPDGVVVRDRGSQRGTRVNGTTIGGSQARDTLRLLPGTNEVIAGAITPLGRQDSPFRFQILVE